jgi:hypothetical protein
MSDQHNPPAFPVSVPGHVYGDGSSETPYVAQEGMTLRDYLAAKAMQNVFDYHYTGIEANEKEIARIAYEIADAMLIERARRKPGAYDDTDEQ